MGPQLVFLLLPGFEAWAPGWVSKDCRLEAALLQAHAYLLGRGSGRQPSKYSAPCDSDHSVLGDAYLDHNHVGPRDYNHSTIQIRPQTGILQNWDSSWGSDTHDTVAIS